MARCVRPGEEGGFWYAIGLDKDVEALVDVAEQKVGQEGDVVLVRFFGGGAQFGDHVVVAGAGGEEQKAGKVLGLVQAFLGQDQLALLRGEGGELAPLLLAVGVFGQSVGHVQVAQD